MDEAAVLRRLPAGGLAGLIPSTRVGWSVGGPVGWFLYWTRVANETNRRRRGPQSLFTNCLEVPLWVFILSSEIRRLRECAHRFRRAGSRPESGWANSDLPPRTGGRASLPPELASRCSARFRGELPVISRVCAPTLTQACGPVSVRYWSQYVR